MKCPLEKPIDCYSCPYPDCVDGDSAPTKEETKTTKCGLIYEKKVEYQRQYAETHPRTEYFKAYYLNFTEEQKQRNRETALAYYRKNRDRINEAKREKRRLERAEH